MNALLAVMAALLSALALYLPTRTQSFTHVVVGGRSIRMLVAGQGDTTVVFENGYGGPLENWGKVQPGVSRFAKTVSYDRAGVGLSDKRPPPRDGRRIADELRLALQAANIAPPYILVGASLGGPYVRVFAGAYPDDVAGLVLVDPTPDSEQFNRTDGLPELEAWPGTRAQARDAQRPAGMPVFLIDALSPAYVPFTTEAYRALRLRNRAELEAESVEYQEWLRTIPGSRLIVTGRSGHNVAQEQPELVVAAIRELLELVVDGRGKARARE